MRPGNPLPGAPLRFWFRFLTTLRLRLGAGSGLPSAGLFDHFVISRVILFLNSSLILHQQLMARILICIKATMAARATSPRNSPAEQSIHQRSFRQISLSAVGTSQTYADREPGNHEGEQNHNNRSHQHKLRIGWGSRTQKKNRNEHDNHSPVKGEQQSEPTTQPYSSDACHFCRTLDVEAPADQAPIQLETLSPVASHALFGDVTEVSNGIGRFPKDLRFL